MAGKMTRKDLFLNNMQLNHFYFTGVFGLEPCIGIEE